MKKALIFLSIMMCCTTSNAQTWAQESELNRAIKAWEKATEEMKVVYTSALNRKLKDYKGFTDLACEQGKWEALLSSKCASKDTQSPPWLLEKMKYECMTSKTKERSQTLTTR